MEGHVIHDSHRLSFRDPFGAVPAGTPVRLSLSSSMPLTACRLEWEGDTLNGHVSGGISLDRRAGEEEFLYSARLDALSVPGTYFYYFVLEQGEERLFYGNQPAAYGGEGVLSRQTPIPYQITVYQSDLSVPEWFGNTILYQIFPDRFLRAPDSPSPRRENAFFYGSWQDRPVYLKEDNGDILRWEFYGGDLRGIAVKLDYLRKLGVGTLYLNPIFEAASNHRYDTGDYRKVDSILGGEEALDDLLDKARQEGMHILLDGVFSHTGRDSRYFDAFGRYGGQGAYHNPSSPYRGWYRFGETDEEYDCWWGVKALPNVNEMEPSFLNYLLLDEDSVVRYWYRKGISGWRLDVADELPDEFLQLLRQVSEETCQEEPVLLGEVWEDGTNKISYGQRRMYYTAAELHTNTNYPFRSLLVDFLAKKRPAAEVQAAFLSLQENYPRHNFYALVNMTGSHDVERLMTAMLRVAENDYEQARLLVRCYAAVLFTFPGVPLIYYGDETCLEGGSDPDNRRPYPWGQEDRAMIEWFSSLGKLRMENRVLRQGEWRFCPSSQPQVLAYERYLSQAPKSEWESILVLVSPEKDCLSEVCLDGLEAGRVYRTLFSGGETAENYCVMASCQLRVPVRSFVVLGFSSHIGA